MNTTIGTGMTGLSLDTGSGTQNWYFTRFVSPPIFDTSISANTWTYNFAAWQQQHTANFPVSGTNSPVRVNVYVWRPGSGTKVGTILDGNTASTVAEGPGDGTRGHHVTFSGSSVAGVQGFDVIIIEIWFIITAGASGRQGTFHYDGTTVNTTENATVTNHASFLETPQTLTLTGGITHFDRTANASFTIVDGITKQKQANRTVGNSFTVSAIVSRFKDAGRTINETVSISAPVVRVFSTVRSISDSFTIVANGLGEKAFARSVSETFMVGGSVARLSRMMRTSNGSFTIVVDVVRLRTVINFINEILTVTDGVVSSFMRIRTALTTLSISADITKDYSGHRTVNETVNLSNVEPVRILTANRTPAATVVLSAIGSRMKKAFRTTSNTLTIVGATTLGKKVSVSLSETLTTVSTGTVRHLRAIRVINQSISVVTDNLLRTTALLFERIVGETVEISASVARLRRVPKTIGQTIAIVTTVITKLCRADEY